jgi:hypothetical protein
MLLDCIYFNVGRWFGLAAGVYNVFFYEPVVLLYFIPLWWRDWRFWPYCRTSVIEATIQILELSNTHIVIPHFSSLALECSFNPF